MSDKIKVMESIALRGMAKYGNIKRGIRDMQTIDDYATDSAAGYLNKNKESQTQFTSVLTKISDRLDLLEAK